MKYLLPLLLTAAAWAAPDRPSLTVPYSTAEPSLENPDQDIIWEQAAFINHLEPPLGITAGETPASTKIAILWTKQNLLIRFQCTAPSITRLPGAHERDLPYYRADCVEVFLDPVGDGRAFIEIQASPDNGIMDGLHLHTAAVESDPDFTVKPDITNRDAWFFKEWNMAGLRSTATLHPGTGWTITLAIPAKDLLRRLGKSEFAAGMKLRANFLRFDHSTKPGQITNWARVPPGRAHRAPAGMGSLVLAE
jgi:hypothetical protein